MKINSIAFSTLFTNENLYFIPSKKEIKQKNTLGNNQKKCLILVNEQEQQVIDENNLTFLQNILKAISYTLDDILLLNIASYPLTFEELINNYSPKQLILFDVSAFQLGIQERQIIQYELHEINNLQLISADSLTEIQKNIDKKKALWINLQRIFLNN